MPYYGLDWTYSLVLIGAVLAAVASARVKTTYAKFGKVRSHSGISALQAARTILDNAFKKQYRDGSYIPVRVNTPSILIEATQSLGKSIEDLPVILNVEKARQMMSSQRAWVLEQKRGTAHELTVDDVIALIIAMNKPKYIVFQTADERFVEVVEFETERKQKAVAVLEIGENKNPEYLNGYNGGFYQVLITAFEPDTGYVETLLNKNGNIKIYPKKKKGSSQRGSGNRVPSHLNESPFANSILHSEPKVNSNSKKDFALPEDIDSADVSKEVSALIREDILQGREDHAAQKKKAASVPKKQTSAQTAKKNANVNHRKVYTRKDSRDVISSIVAERLSIDGKYYGKLVGASRESAIEILWSDMNRYPKGERSGAALQLAEYIQIVSREKYKNFYKTY